MPSGLLQKIQRALRGAPSQTSLLTSAPLTGSSNRPEGGEDLASMPREDLLAVLWPWGRIEVETHKGDHPLSLGRLRPPDKLWIRTESNAPRPPNRPLGGWMQSPRKFIPPELF
jgi:hypothetical protein